MRLLTVLYEEGETDSMELKVKLLCVSPGRPSNRYSRSTVGEALSSLTVAPAGKHAPREHPPVILLVSMDLAGNIYVADNPERHRIVDGIQPDDGRARLTLEKFRPHLVVPFYGEGSAHLAANPFRHQFQLPAPGLFGPRH